uniref:Uncharacterized protein n=1 Tax=Cacopsylla melanoneura TaxID=428564 RepID=A0A8D8X546_9HEMI
MSSDRTIMSLGVILFALMVATEGAPTQNFNVLIISYIRNKGIYPNMMEDIKTEMGENKAVDQIRGIARNQTKKVLNTADNNNASNTEIRNEVIEAMKNKVQKVLVEKEKLVRYEDADLIFSYFIKSFGKDINEEIEKVIHENKHGHVNETTERINHNTTTKASGSSKQSVSCALAILLISFFCL